MYTYTRARIRVVFRKQNKVGSPKFRKQNKGLLYYDKALNYSLLFRKLNKYFNALKCPPPV